MRKFVFDIETNGLDPTKIWCVVLYDIARGNTHVCKDRHSLIRYMSPQRDGRHRRSYEATGVDRP